MAIQYSIQKMVSDGTLSTIALGIKYLQRNDIYMRVAGEETPQSGAPSGYTWSFLDNTTLKILPVVPNGVAVVVYRRTDVDAMYNIYSQNAQFDEATIDENNQQLLYIAQEYLEQGLPGTGIDTIEYVRDDGSFTYYRLRRTDGSYSEEFAVPSASNSTKVLTRESLRRSYAEAGYNLVDGSFEAGGTLVNANDVLLQERTGKAFSGTAGAVAPGTNPIGDIEWKPRADELLRSELSASGGADLVGSESGLGVQGDIDRLMTSATRLSTEISKALLARIKVRKQAGVSPWGQAGPLNILGDSMAHGYFASYENGSATAGGMFYHRWVSIFARMLAAEFGTGHYITCNPNLFDYATDVDIAILTSQSGNWVLEDTGLYTSDLYVGRALTNINSGGYLEYTIPATFKECWVHYVIQPGGGELSISQNGTVTNVLTCSGPSFANGVARLTLASNPQGQTVLRLAKTDAGSGKVGVCAVSPSPGVRENGFQEGCGLNVFAAPGRRLQDLSEKVIQDSCNNAAGLIMALGFNDNPLNGSGQSAGRAAFTQRINWLIQYCTQYDTPLVVLDCSWKNTSDSFTRTELKRLADSAAGVYIPLPDMIKSGTFPTDAYRIGLGMWQDAAHPSRAGHKWIAETLSKILGLGVTTKNEAIFGNDYWISMPLASTYANASVALARNISAYKIGKNSIQLRTQLKVSAGGNFSAGIHNICGPSAGSLFKIKPPINLNLFVTTKECGRSESTGVPLNYAVMYGNGLLQMIRDAAITGPAMNGTATIEIDGSEYHGT